MKNIKLAALVVAMSLAVIGCKDDTPDNNGNNGNGNGNQLTIEGTWNLDSTTQTNGSMKANGIVMGTYSATSDNETGTFDFKSDGTVTSNISYVSVMTISMAGQSFTQRAPIPPTTTTADYDYDESNKKLTLVGQLNDTIVYNVLEHTASNMHLQVPFEQSQTVSGMSVTSSATLDIYVSR